MPAVHPDLYAETAARLTLRLQFHLEIILQVEVRTGLLHTLDFSDVKKCKLKPTYDFKPAKEGK